MAESTVREEEGTPTVPRLLPDPDRLCRMPALAVRGRIAKAEYLRISQWRPTPTLHPRGRVGLGVGQAIRNGAT